MFTLLEVVGRKDTAEVGTIVEILADGVYEVEFVDTDGRTIGIGALRQDQLAKAQ